MNALLSFRKLCAGYETTRILGPVSFTLNLGQGIRIDGSPSSGKSTLLKSIFGRSQILSGEIIADNTLIDRTSPPSPWKIKAGAVWQPRELIDALSVNENLTLVNAIDINGRWTNSLLENFYNSSPISHRSDSLVSSLSGGERTLLNWAIAFHRAIEGVLIVDDGVASLQPETTSSVVNLVEAGLNKNQFGLLYAGELPLSCKVCKKIDVVKL